MQNSLSPALQFSVSYAINIISSITSIKTSLPSKSELYEQRIREIIDIIVTAAKDKIAFIILFGPFARGDLMLEKISSNYHFLVITKIKRYAAKNSAIRLEKRITDEINKKIKDKTHSIHLMIEPVDYVNCAVNKKRYFFADVKKAGILLYDSKEFELLKLPESDIKERIKAAKINYFYLLNKAKIFIKYFYFGIANDDFKGAAFNLHQATEFLFNCALLVFNGYEAKTHDLKKLNNLCAANSNQFLTIFPTILPEEKRSFSLLQQAYLQSRYNEQYEISKDQLEYLSDRVEVLMRVVIESCGEVLDGHRF
jgi:HEPN domain-containing protein